MFGDVEARDLRDLMVAQDLTALLRVPFTDILLRRPSCTLSGTVCTDFNLHGLSSGSLELDSFNCAGSWRCAEDADGPTLTGTVSVLSVPADYIPPVVFWYVLQTDLPRKN